MTNNNKIDQELEVSIDLENFEYSGTKHDKDRKNDVPHFFGRAREKDRLLDRLIQGKGQGGSFLVAGYRGVGKTRFVTEVLCNYRNKGSFFSKRNFIEVRVNLGNDGDLNSKSVLFNMIYLLNNALREKKWVLFFRVFGDIFRSLSLAIISFWILLISLQFFDKTPEKSPEPILSNEITLFLNNYPGLSIFFLFLYISIWILIHCGKFPTFNLDCFYIWNAFIKLKSLQQEIYSAIDNHAQIKSNYFDFGKKSATAPLTTNQIEARLKNVLKILKNQDVIFVFDELDKLTGKATSKQDTNLDLAKESKLRKQQIDSILGDLKNLITDSNARYIFIAGRDMYDAYLSERGSSNSLYESLFHDHIYIPSLLTDRSDGEIYLLDSMIEAFVVSNLISQKDIERTLKEKIKNQENLKHNLPEDLSNLRLSDYVDSEREKEIKKQKRERGIFRGLPIDLLSYSDNYCPGYREKQKEKIKKELELSRLQRDVYILKILIHFLALHSWGNCKRLFTLFESFVRLKNDKYQLYFSTRDIQRLILSSQLYILFHHNLSRILMNADDKLVVSSFSVFHYILKYHGIGFSREHILRMYETINIHSSPELTRIVDIIIHNVLLNHVRKVWNGFYQYRFTFLHEKEIHFITTINDGESAAFNFSLNAMETVKQHYKNLIVESKQTGRDEEYGRTALASIHIIVGNFHFWEQSFDEATVHYGTALDMLEKNGELTKNQTKADLVIQIVEIYLKQGSAAERVNDYSMAAAIYLNAENLAKEYLENLKEEIKDRDPKWDILRQPGWARLFLNLKQGSGYYKHGDLLLPGNVPADILNYRKAALLFFMERFDIAKTALIDVIRYLKAENTEHSCFLIGNAYLKAGFILFLEHSSNLHLELKKIEKNENDCLTFLLRILIDSIGDAFIGIEKYDLLDECDLLIEHEKGISDIETNSSVKGVMCRVIRLLNLSALTFEQGKLYSNAAISYLSMVMVWEAFLEVLPWKKDKISEFDWDKKLDIWSAEKHYRIRETIEQFRFSNNKKEKNWIFKAQQKAFDLIGLNTGEAYHHSMKSILERNLKNKKIEKESFFEERVQRNRVLKNNDLLFQQFSLFGQVIAASIYWEEIAANNMRIADDNENFAFLKGIKNKVIPYGTKQYSMMLWLRGRGYLSSLLRTAENEDSLSETDVEIIASNAIVNLFRSSQYVVKTHGETSNMILPPLFILYYNIWEVLFFMTEKELKKAKQKEHKVCKVRVSREYYSLEQAVYTVRFNLGKQLKKSNIKDVSSRVFDLFAVKDMAVEQYKIIESMGDLSSSSRMNIFRNRYYLDDDYEDNMFILDWSYCRFFAPSAVVHGEVIEYRMRSLEEAFDNFCKQS